MIRRGLLIAALAAMMAPTLNAAGSTEPILTLYYTASLNGNLDGCECKSRPRSGLVKRAHYLREKTDPSQRILVDAGDILHHRPDELLSREILETYAELGYDLVSVGDQELAGGPDALLEYVETYPFLSSNNLQICPNPERCVFVSLSPSIVERNGISVGLFALTHPDVYRGYSDDVKDIVKVGDPLDAAEGALMRLRDGIADLKILVYHAPVEAAVEMAVAYPEIDIIVVGHDQRTVDAQKVGKTVIVSPGQDGNKLGALAVALTDSGEVRIRNRFINLDYLKDPDDPATRGRIESYLKKLTEQAKTGT